MKKIVKNLIWCGIVALLILLFHLLSGNRAVMNALAGAALPVKQAFARVCSLFPFSVAELECTLAVLFLPGWVLWTCLSAAREKPRWPALLRCFSFLLGVLLTLYLFFCLLLGASYRADSFQDRSSLKAEPESIEALTAATELFAQHLCETADTVPRDRNGAFAVSVEDIFAGAADIYRGAEALFPILALRDVTPKAARYSRLLSYVDTTGFYFPFTGEANINTDPPPALIPATIAHEMAHQRGVASEQEANFIAILACSESGMPAYVYSGWLFGFIHLGNALYRYDPETYREIAARLPEEVWKDLRDNNAYWAGFDTPAAEVSTAVYDSMLRSYGQELGVRSYGAVVDLILAWVREGGFGDA